MEVGLRDGLQDEPIIVSTETKLAVAVCLSQAGFSAIQATSFVHPKWIPALSDADALALRLPSVSKVIWNALVPNMRGYERAKEAGIRFVDLVASASESHNKANLNRTTEESMRDFEAIVERAHVDGIRVRGDIATAFGCPFEIAVPRERVIWQAEWYVRMGVEEIGLADTIGVAQPRQVYEVFQSLALAYPGLKLSAHFHDRRGFGLANVLAALEGGATAFDASIGSLGGCPYAPGAPGNLSTKLLVEFLEEMGVKTGINLEKLEEAEKLLLSAVHKV